jgi:hypothetical protein
MDSEWYRIRKYVMTYLNIVSLGLTSENHGLFLRMSVTWAVIWNGYLLNACVGRYSYTALTQILGLETDQGVSVFIVTLVSVADCKWIVSRSQAVAKGVPYWCRGIYLLKRAWIENWGRFLAFTDSGVQFNLLSCWLMHVTWALLLPYVLIIQYFTFQGSFSQYHFGSDSTFMLVYVHSRSPVLFVVESSYWQ